MKGDEALLDIDSLNYDFWRVRKKLKQSVQKQDYGRSRIRIWAGFWSRFGIIFENQTQKISPISRIWLRFSPR